MLWPHDAFSTQLAWVLQSSHWSIRMYRRASAKESEEHHPQKRRPQKNAGPAISYLRVIVEYLHGDQIDLWSLIRYPRLEVVKSYLSCSFSLLIFGFPLPILPKSPFGHAKNLIKHGAAPRAHALAG